MAKNESLIKLKGNIGGLSFYDSDGENFVRMANGPDKEKILNDPAYKRTRENMKEFEGSAKIDKDFRSLFAEVIQTMGETRLVGRITGLMKRINSMGAGIRGERSFEFTNFSDLLKGFEFNRTDTFGRAFYAPPLPISLNANRDIFTWDIPDFNGDSYIHAPEGSTHFKLILAGGVLCNYSYDSSSESFEAAEKDVNLIKNMIESSEMPVSGNIGSAINLSCDLGIGAALSADVIVVAATGIIFYQEINSQFYELASGNAMRIDAVG